jgi:hypothetical protein
MIDLGHLAMSDDLVQLRVSCLLAVRGMAKAIFPERLEAPRPTGKEIDDLLLPLQADIRAKGLNSVWAEKMRLSAKASVLEQWKRRQSTLFGRFKNIATRGDHPMKDGHLRLVNFSEAWSRALSAADVTALQTRMDPLDFRGVMALASDLRDSDVGFTAHQADALRSVVETVETRFGCPEWSEEACIQLHLDTRCVRGGDRALSAALGHLTKGLVALHSASASLAMTGPVCRGPQIDLDFRLTRRVSKMFADRTDQSMTSLAIELGPTRARLRGVVSRPERELSLLGARIVLGEDFGFSKTSSMVVVRSKSPIDQDILDFVGSAPDKAQTKAYLETHISGDDIEVLEEAQFCGRNFLDFIKQHAASVDTLRSEIDLNYNRLDRIRREINVIAGVEPGALVPEAPAVLSASPPEKNRYLRMHARFFRLLGGIGKLKQKRRDVYKKVAAVKKNWLGYVVNAKVRLAEKHGAVVVSEDLTILTVPKDDPTYKGRTFNKMINNGAKGQYIRRSEDKLKWWGIPHRSVPSFYSSTTDWRTGTVDKNQRKNGSPIFKAHDGTTWDADLHAGELLARWLFLKPKSGLAPAL